MKHAKCSFTDGSIGCRKIRHDGAVIAEYEVTFSVIGETSVLSLIRKGFNHSTDSFYKAELHAKFSLTDESIGFVDSYLAV